MQLVFFLLWTGKSCFLQLTSVVHELSSPKIQAEHHCQEIFVPYCYPTIHVIIIVSEGVCKNLGENSLKMMTKKFFNQIINIYVVKGTPDI